jgi:hypothetical protein
MEIGDNAPFNFLTFLRRNTENEVGKTGNADAGAPGLEAELDKGIFLTPRLK